MPPETMQTSFLCATSIGQLEPYGPADADHVAPLLLRECRRQRPDTMDGMVDRARACGIGADGDRRLSDPVDVHHIELTREELKVLRPRSHVEGEREGIVVLPDDAPDHDRMRHHRIMHRGLYCLGSPGHGRAPASIVAYISSS